MSPCHLRTKAPRALGKAGVPARRDSYLLPDYAYPASPTAIGLLKNLTEKIGPHTLFYDQKQQSKTTANNSHSFCRFCACAIWWPPRKQSHETAPRGETTRLTQCGEQSELQKQELGYVTLPSRHGRSTLWGLHLPPLLQREPRASGGGSAGTALALPPRRSAAFGNHSAPYTIPSLPLYFLPMYLRLQIHTSRKSVLLAAQIQHYATGP